MRFQIQSLAILHNFPQAPVESTKKKNNLFHSFSMLKSLQLVPECLPNAWTVTPSRLPSGASGAASCGGGLMLNTKFIIDLSRWSKRD